MPNTQVLLRSVVPCKNEVSTTAPFRSKCFKCLGLGSGKKLKIIGVNTIERTNNPMMLIKATNPNCTSNSDFVMASVPKPTAVVRLVKKIAFPVLNTIRVSDFI